MEFDPLLRWGRIESIKVSMKLGWIDFRFTNFRDERREEGRTRERSRYV